MEENKRIGIRPFKIEFETEEEYEAFLDFVYSPPEPNERMRELMERHRLLKVADPLRVKDGKIQLDPNNPSHVDWFENDEEYEKEDEE